MHTITLTDLEMAVLRLLIGNMATVPGSLGEDTASIYTKIDNVSDAVTVSSEMSEAIYKLGNMPSPFSTTVVLTDNYTALIRKNGTVKVGCQTIAPEAVRSFINKYEDTVRG